MRWEYQTLEVELPRPNMLGHRTPPEDLGALTRELNRLGQEGWELVTSTVAQNLLTILYTFKRPMAR